MNRKALIFISTIAVCLMAAIVSCVWLFRVRYIDLSVTAPDGDVLTYSEVNEKLNGGFSGKIMFAVSVDEVSETLSSDPYIKVVEVKKVFPDRLSVSVVKRVEKYVIVGKNSFYITDDDFILLRKSDKSEDLNTNLIRIEVSEKDISESEMREGQPVAGRVDGLFGSAVEIFNSFENKFDIIESINISGDFYYVSFKTKTGVVFDFSFLIGNSAPTDTEFEQVKPIIVSKARDLFEYYSSLEVEKKRSGVIFVNFTVDKEVLIAWSAE